MADLLSPQFTNADNAREYLERLRWPHGTVCPHCGVIGTAYALNGATTRPGLWKCKDCRKQFSVTVGTVFERSKVPLNKWLLAVHLICASKKAVSSHQIHRMLGLTYKTAWFVTHRIREAMKPGNTGLMGTGGGIVEADETFWGNKGKNNGKPGFHHKMKVVSLVERGGEKRSFVVGGVNAKALREVLDNNVDKSAHLRTDEHRGYVMVGREFASHRVTRHTLGEYALPGGIHSNTVESSFSLLKRGLIGTFHHVGEQHLQRYCTEFDFRWNTRTKMGFTDAERADELLRGIGGKRLMYAN